MIGELKALNVVGNTESLKLQELLILLSNSLLCGLVLTIITFYVAKSLSTNTSKSYDPKIEEKDKENKNKEEAIETTNLFLGSANILFLCISLTGVMILVNNNLARAFAIGAALAITRFRVKVGPKILASNLLFGVIIGVANGLSEITLAWLLTIIYVFLELVLLFIAKKYFTLGNIFLKDKNDNGDE
ncbi:MAG: hypothetical protein HQK51_17860 [Oligoflexia bacterium]|nr:hypothetical protein [Oligoflexia bacterium]